jgi:hypothetical protein
MANVLRIVLITSLLSSCSFLAPEYYFYNKPNIKRVPPFGLKGSQLYWRRKKIYKELVFPKVVKKNDTVYVSEVNIFGSSIMRTRFRLFTKDTLWIADVSYPDKYIVKEYPVLAEKQKWFIKSLKLDSLKKYSTYQGIPDTHFSVLSRIVLKEGRIKKVKMIFPPLFHIWVNDPHEYDWINIGQ